MDRVVALLQGESSRNLLLALAHSLWEGALVGGLLFLYLRRTPAQAADKRYFAGIGALGGILLGALLTWSILSYKPAAAPSPTPSTAASDVSLVASGPTDSVSSAPREGQFASPATAPSQAPSRWQVWLLEAWMVGVVLMFMRLVAVVIGGGRLRQSCRPIEDSGTLDLFRQLCGRMGIGRNIRVLVGAQIGTPGVVGCFWPTLLLPASMLTGVPPEDLQAILAHELAHIRRYDYLVNFFQMVVEALLFFNPAVWWIGRQIRIEREACCDAAGVRWTGQGVRYAEALVAWAQRTAPGPVPALGFGRDADRGSILDRVRRILVAGHQPRPRVPWPTATAMVVLTLACLVVLQQTTNVAVSLAGRILTPQERIDKIAGISKEYGYDNREYGPEDKVAVSGVVRTWDGKPLPHGASVLVRQTGGRSSASIGISVSQDGTFHTSTNPGRIYVTASADGYAPASAGPFQARPGAPIEGIELVLQDGFPGRIQTVDETGQPIPGAELIGGYTGPEDGSYSHTIKLTTDANGIAALAHAAALAMTLQINADGYEFERIQGLVLSAGQVKAITLRKAQPTTGVILSQATGQPIAGAEVRILVSARGGQSFGEGGITRAPEAITGTNGQFELNRLRSDCQYLLFITAPGYGYRYVPDVVSGRNVQVLLGEKKIIRGTITGDLSLLPTDTKTGGPVLYAENSYRFPEFSGYTDSSIKIPVTVRNGIGSFEIDDFWGQTVTLRAGNEIVRLNVQEDRLDNIEINLRPSAQRQVVLRFATPAAGPPITGEIRIDYITDRARQRKQSMTPQWLDIVDGQARCEIPVPAQFKYSIDFHQGKRPAGYWFNEIPQVTIEPGDGPYMIDVPVFPAGAIYGKILRPDGSAADRARAALMIAKKPPIENGRAISLSDLFGALDNAVDGGTFNATPLPLGGEYAVVAYENYAFAMSDAFTLDEKNPIVNVDLQLPQGVDVVGRLLDVDGTAARNNVSLDVSIKRGEHSWGMNCAQTRPDEEGRFVFKNVNVGPQGECSIRVIGGAGYRPLTHKIENLRAPVVIQLEKGHRVTGSVIDDITGRPVPKAEVYAFAVDGPDGQISRSWEMLEAEGRTDEQGRFAFTNMAASQYSLNVRSANLADPRRPVIVTGGQNDPVVLRIRIPEWSDLKPRQP